MFARRTNKQKIIFFVHIPKTAGTSFRAALEGISRNVLKDYSSNNKETSALVQEWAYEKEDFSELKNSFIKGRYHSVCGHVYVDKYMDFAPLTNIVTFVREPVSRVVSNYNHDTKYNGWTGSFEDYVSDPKYQNIQSKLLGSIPLELIGFVGLTECYPESLDFINQLYSRHLKLKQRNLGKSPNISLAQLSPEMKEKIESANQADMELYNHAKKFFEQRVDFAQTNPVAQWAYANVEVNKNGSLIGCAFRADSSAPVTLTLKVDGQASGKVIAKNFYDGFVKAQFPRHRYVGFELKLEKSLLANQLITLEVSDTGQVIYENRES